MDVAEFLAHRRSEGRFDSSGNFSLSLERARRKLRVYQDAWSQKGTFLVQRVIPAAAGGLAVELPAGRYYKAHGNTGVLGPDPKPAYPFLSSPAGSNRSPLPGGPMLASTSRGGAEK
ncbi:MAG: hypothetical protein HY319_05490 [Armatimonadetes bacterium]|nr:hypothetical protein [Armatimonadota bacterium]